jgi:hypothetical protein
MWRRIVWQQCTDWFLLVPSSVVSTIPCNVCTVLPYYTASRARRPQCRDKTFSFVQLRRFDVVIEPSSCLICFHLQGAIFCSCARVALLALKGRHMLGIVFNCPSVCCSWRTVGQILMKFGVRHHVEAAFPKGISHVVAWIKNDCQYGGVPGLILLKMRIGLKFVKSELILSTVKLYEFWAVSEDSSLLACDARLLNEWLQTFRRTVSHSSSRFKKLQKKRVAVMCTNDSSFSVICLHDIWHCSNGGDQKFLFY